MRTYIQVLISLQLLSIMASIIAAVVEIETIVWTGPIFSIVGLLIAVPCYRQHFPTGLYFGLSVPTISILCFSIILGLQWGPSTAAVPISCLLVLFAIVALPLGAFAIREGRLVTIAKRRTTLQFGIMTLLGLMALVAVLSFLVRTGSVLAAATGILISYTSVCCYVLRRFHRHGKDYGTEWVAPVIHQGPNRVAGRVVTPPGPHTT